jgi:hypothetical protein
MRTLTFMATLFFATLSLSAQVTQQKFVGDTLGPWAVINFEEPSPYIQINASLQNMWQIGTPQKPLFNQSYSIPNAIVTELTSYYTVGNHSWFDLYIGGFNTNWYYSHDLFIDFRHKTDSDTLHDGGYITVSWDKGQTWMNILDDTISKQYFFVSPASNWGMWGNTNLYTLADTLFNGEHGFSGSSNGWVHSCMAWYDLPVKHPASFPPDTMILRFNFISDTIHHNKAGWMIDDIRIYAIDLGSGIKDPSEESIQFKVTPNPLKNNALISLSKSHDHVEYRLMDGAGRILSRGSPGKCSEFKIHRTNLPPGVYLLQVTDGRARSHLSRIILL